MSRLRLAYADPPYRGCCSIYGHHHPDGRCWDDAETHRQLVERLNRDFPDGWALSCKSDAKETRGDSRPERSLNDRAEMGTYEFVVIVILLLYIAIVVTRSTP